LAAAGDLAMLQKLPEELGHALVNQRAGMDQVVYNRVHAERDMPRLTVSSPAFAFNGRLPVRYTADGEGTSPPLAWGEVPEDAHSWAIIVEDADSPTPHPLVHAIAVDIAKEHDGLAEGALSSGDTAPGLDIGTNSFFTQGWLPPDPPPGHGEHRYVFQVFALREGAPFSKGAGRGELVKAILDRAIAVGCLIGTYERSVRKPIETEQEAPLEAMPGTA
jgi:Raf kinase inhibitor-like YbhB/YbcL family protein